MDPDLLFKLSTWFYLGIYNQEFIMNLSCLATRARWKIKLIQNPWHNNIQLRNYCSHVSPNCHLIEFYKHGKYLVKKIKNEPLVPNKKHNDKKC